MSLRRPARPALAALCVAGMTAALAPAAGATTTPTPAPSATPAPTPAPPPIFTDVPGTTHEQAITLLAAAEVLRGFDDGTFKPNASITRGQLAAVLARALGLVPTPPAEGEERLVFSDTPGTTHADAIQALADAGITSGYQDGTFRPNTPIDRGQTAALLVRAGGITPVSYDCFSDLGDVEQYADAICALAARGVLGGFGDGTFGPKSEISRGQTSSVVARSLGLVDPAGTDYVLTVLHNNDGESDLLGDVADDDGNGEGVGSISRYGALLKTLASGAALGDDRGSIAIAAGDNFLASPELQASQALPEGASIYDAVALDSLPYDAFVIGNHEFDFGADFLARFIGDFSGRVPFLSANLDFTDVPALQALVDEGRIRSGTTITEDDRTIAVVALTTPELREVSSPGATQIDEDLTGVAQAQVDAARAAGADVVVLASHLQAIANEQELVGTLTGVDAVVGGGGGEELQGGAYPLGALDKGGKPVPVVTVPGDYEDVGNLTLALSADNSVVGFGGGLVPVLGTLPQDRFLLENVERPVADYLEELQTTEVAQSAAPLNGVRDDVRTRETNVGNLLADAFIDIVGASGEVDGPLVGLQNGGGIRNDSLIGPGSISAADVFDIAPFDNRVAVLEDVAAPDLLTAIEHGLSGLPEAAGSFGQWGGLTIRYDPAAAADDRVVSVSLADGTPLVAAGEPVAGAPAVDVATINFLAAGNDGYDVFESYDFTILGTSYAQALRDKLAAESPIAADDAEYGAGSDGQRTPTRVVPVPAA